MDIRELDAQLLQAQNYYRANMRHDKGGDAHRQLLEAERALALARGEETALACDWPVKWEIGAPLPHIICSEHRVFLTYLLSEPTPLGDGSYTTIVAATVSGSILIALVEFVGCDAVRFGAPNDEVIQGHRLYGNGLAPYRAHVIANSKWIAELKQINSVHSLYNPANWDDAKNYVLLFHDTTFECIATDHRIEVFNGTFGQVLDIAKARLLER
jgi:hypothetical protein